MILAFILICFEKNKNTWYISITIIILIVYHCVSEYHRTEAKKQMKKVQFLIRGIWKPVQAFSIWRTLRRVLLYHGVQGGHVEVRNVWAPPPIFIHLVTPVGLTTSGSRPYSTETWVPML